MKRSPLFTISIVIAATLIISLVSATIIRGGVYETTLSDVTLQEKINKSLESQTDTLNPPKRNYTISDETYFENREWVAAIAVDTSSDHTEPATIVMQFQNNEYATVLGPGTSFPKSLVNSLPKSVQDYLTSRELVFEDEGETDE